MPSENGGIVELVVSLTGLIAVIIFLWRDPIFRAALIWFAHTMLEVALVILLLGIFLGLLFIVVKES
ncbi:MAG: hypothetical protein DRJ52_05685 [Thermoprotei archaeon]|nr:MAG: hypothetical protein DRJ52_05685 [Thermoprotei archaeon]